MSSAVMTEPGAITLPAMLVAGDAAPVVLTARSLLRHRTDVAISLHNARYDVPFVAAWERLPEAIERIAADVVLVDMDSAGESVDGTRGLSGHRLVQLLARQLAHLTPPRPVALVVMTALDFEEIEDLARAGIHALVPPNISPKALVRQIQATLDRVRGRHLRSACPVAVAGAPVDPDAAGPRANLDRPLGDAQWEEIAPLLPPGRPGAYRRISDRQVMEAALFLLRRDLPWSALPPVFGSPATVRRRLRLWRDAGVFERLRAAGLHLRGPLAGLPWERLSATRTTRKRVAPVASRA